MSLLGKQIGQLHDATARLRRASTIIRRSHEAILHAACLGTLVYDEAPPNDVAYASVDQVAEELAVERRQSDMPRRQRPTGWTEPQVDSRWDAADLPSLPPGWLWSSVGFAATRMQYGVSVRSDADADTGVPNIGMQNLQRGNVVATGLRYVSLDEADRASFRLSPGDVLFNRTNSAELVGKAAVFDLSMEAVFASYLVRVQVDNRVARPAWVVHWINSPWGRAWAKGVKRDAIGQSNINSSKLARMPIPLPPVAQQDQICARVEQLRDQADVLEERVEANLQEARNVNEALLHQAFAGALVDRVAVTQDEHPTTLIARAKQELRTRRATAASIRMTEARMKTPNSEALVRKGIDEMPSDTFTFADLHASVPVKYDEIVSKVFSFLEDPNSGVTQIFDREAEEIRLARRSST